MIHYIENSYLKVGVKEFGGELTSIISKESGYEFLWQGNPDIWSGQSPVLFPVIGRLIDDGYTLDGKAYQMPKHGFARKLPWRLLSESDCEMSFILSENEETLPVYPYRFDLIITFSLEDKKLTVKHEVINKNDAEMYFSLGAHPAFSCEIGDVLVFDENETLERIKIDLERSLRIAGTTPLLDNEKEITVTKDVFKEDALIFEGAVSDNITLRSKSTGRSVKFNLGKAPYLGIWAKPGAPYVCIEPWYGVNDSTERKADFSEKDGIQRLASKEKFTFTWSAEFSE